MRLLGALVLVVMCTAACKSGDKARQATPSGGSGSAAPSASGVAEPDAREFAEKLALSVRPCDPNTAAALFDNTTYAKTFCDWMQGITSYRLVGVRRVDGVVQPILRRFRVDADNALRVNYDTFVLAKKDASIIVADVYSYRQGKWLSELVSPAPPHADVAAARTLVREGRPGDALALLDKLPPAVRKDRAVLTLAIHAATSVSADREKQALAELATAFPNDPAVALTQIDGAYDRADFAAMLTWVDILANEIGSEPYLDTLRAIALLELVKLDEALARITDATSAEPSLTRSHEVKLDVLIAKKDWPAAIAVMTTLEKGHGFSFDPVKMQSEPKLAELVASPAYATWIAERQ